MRNKCSVLLTTALLILTGTFSAFAQDPFLKQVDIYVSGTDGYDTFRIPAMTVTQKGTILAFCEGRKNNMSDTGNIDMLLKRSFNNGMVWEPVQVIWDDGPNVCGNPCVVIDKTTGTIFLLMTHNLGIDHERQIIDGESKGTRTVWITQSEDDGATWTKPVEITGTTKQSNWTWYATGPGVGIQLKSGRLIIPCDHMEAVTKKYFSHIIYSDNHGKTWKTGGSAGDLTNECQAVELKDGSLLLNMRNYSSHKLRALSTSKDGGLTWTEVTHDPMLYEPICQAGFIRYTASKNSSKNRLLFSNPASNTSRILMTVRLSYDEGKTWPMAKILEQEHSAYSSLAVLQDNTIACLHERGKNNPYEKITFSNFNLEWLTDGKDKTPASRD